MKKIELGMIVKTKRKIRALVEDKVIEVPDGLIGCVCDISDIEKGYVEVEFDDFNIYDIPVFTYSVKDLLIVRN